MSNPSLNVTFIDDKTKHLQKKIPSFLFFFVGLPWCENLSQKKKKKTMNLMHLPQKRSWL